jgi:hypothetical protein
MHQDPALSAVRITNKHLLSVMHFYDIFH